MTVIWVPTDLVYEWHMLLLQKDGGAEGIRDKGLLESAMARPKTTLCQLAASYGFGLANNHVFIDGNKRVAFAVMTAFLKANGMVLDVSEKNVTETILALAARKLSEKGLVEWLDQNTFPEY